MRVLHALRKLAPASELISYHRLSFSSYTKRAGRSKGPSARASLTPLRSAPIKFPAGAATEQADMGRGKMQGDRQGKANTSCYIQVLGLGTDTGDSVPSVLLFFDHYRFLFNAGEGFQRFCVQHRIRMGKTTGIFATRSTTQALGGLPGMLLTMADMGSSGGIANSFLAELGATSMSLHGPPGLATLANAIGTFVNTADMGLEVKEFGMPQPPPQGAEELPPLLQNEVVTITPAVLHPASSVQQGDSAAPAVNGSDAAADAEPAAKRQRLEEGAAADDNGGITEGQVVGGVVVRPAACYLCQLPDIPGKFQIDKARALGVPKGPAYSKLVTGESVLASNGATVTPAEVLDPSTPGPVALVVDVPSAAFLPALLSHPTLKRCQGTDGSEPEQAVAVTVHLSPADVVALPEYQAWMKGCGAKTQHIVVNAADPGGNNSMLPSSAGILAKLNVLAPTVFPLRQPSTPPAKEEPAAADAGMQVTPGHNLLRHWLRPVKRQGLDSSEVQPAFDAAAVQAELREQQPDVIKAAAAFSGPAVEGEAVPEVVRGAARDELEVVFLGTGAAIPAKYRNVTGIYVHLFARGGLMLDCGEGSYGQLVRHFGAARAAEAVSNLGAVWISHIHADHHAGLPRLLAVRQQVLGVGAPPLLIIGPRPLRRALHAYAQLEPLTFVYLDNAHTLAGAEAPEEAAGHLAAAKERTGLTRLQSVRVHHCAQAFGVALTGRAGWSLVFSGDTRPCPAVTAAAKDATILIHEATFEDGLEAEAIAKRHSLTREAVAVGAQANAYRTILTHFSQRYAKLPVIEGSFTASTCVAFDLMAVNLADLPALPRLLPALQLLFKEEGVDEEAAEEAGAAEDAAAALQA